MTTGHPLGRRGVQRAAQRPGSAAELPFRRGAAGDDAHGAAVAVAWNRWGEVVPDIFDEHLGFSVKMTTNDGFRRKNWGDSGILWRIFLPGWEIYG